MSGTSIIALISMSLSGKSPTEISWRTDQSHVNCNQFAGEMGTLQSAYSAVNLLFPHICNVHFHLLNSIFQQNQSLFKDT